jgi:uncharacterized protein YdeI (YjbR/CyaY-like superfamily)
MTNYDARIDAYIDKSADFAKPVLNHLRKLIHQTVPQITEAVKWGMPFFEYKGPVCFMAAFKQHCSFGFWKSGRLLDPHKVLKEEEGTGAGSFGRILSLGDLPTDEIISEYILELVAINERENKAPKQKSQTPKPAAVKAPIATPDYFIILLDQHPAARKVFDNFSASKKREYLEWFEEAKTDATRQKRLDQAIEWISEGKSRNWKYQR